MRGEGSSTVEGRGECSEEEDNRYGATRRLETVLKEEREGSTVSRREMRDGRSVRGTRGGGVREEVVRGETTGPGVARVGVEARG